METSGRQGRDQGNSGLSAARARLRSGFRLGDHEVLPATNKLRVGAEERHLEPRVMELLVHLAARKGEVVSRQELIDVVWRGALIGDEVISRCIYQLRRALDDRAPGELIQTIPKRGYRLAAEVVAVERAPPPAVTAARWRPAGWAVAALALGASLALWLLFAGQPGPPSDPPPVLLEVGGQRPLVVVLPLAASELDDAGLRHREAVSNDLMVTLAHTGVLRVFAYDSSIALAAEGGAFTRRAAELGVSAVLAGSWSSEQGVTRLLLRLTDVRSGEIVWAQDFGFDAAGRFAAYEAVALGVAEALQTPVAAVPARLEATRYTDDVVAHDLYREGRYYWHRRRQGTLELALDFFSQAAEADPAYVLAWTGQADAALLLHQYGELPRETALLRAGQALQQAERINPDAPEVLASRGLYEFYAGDLEASAGGLRRALAADPNAWLAHMWLGRTMEYLGEYRRALASYERARELDPLSPIVVMNTGMALQRVGRDDDAVRALREVVGLDPDFANGHWALGYALLHLGRHAQAVRAYREAIRLGIPAAAVHAQLAGALLDLGLDQAALASLATAARLDATDSWALAVRQKRLLETRDLAGLLGLADELRQADPHSALAYLVAGRALYALGTARSAEPLRRLDSERDRALLLTDRDAEWGELPMTYLVLRAREDGDSPTAAALLDEATAWLQALRARGMDTPAMSYAEACIAALRGDVESAMAQLRQALDRGWRQLRWAAMDPRLALLHAHEAFQELLEEGLALLAAEAAQLD